MAAAAALEIDRLVIAVHRATAGRHGPALCALAAVAGVPTLRPLPDVAEFLLAGRLTRQLASLRFRYSPADVEALSTLADGGYLRADGDALLAGQAIHTLLEGMMEMWAETAADLWPDGGAVTEVARLAAAVAAAGPSTYPLFAAHADLPVPAAPATGLHHRLTTLRYLRADAHAAAWAERGLTADAVAGMTALWKGLPPADAAATTELRAAGWAGGEPIHLTPDGQRLRDEIEAATNEGCEPAFAVDDALGITAALRRLPGDS